MSGLKIKYLKVSKAKSLNVKMRSTNKQHPLKLRGPFQLDFKISQKNLIYKTWEFGDENFI